MSRRLNSWRLAVQGLYAQEMNPSLDNEAFLKLPWLEVYTVSPRFEERQAALLILQHWLHKHLEIDRIIADHLFNWHLARLYPVDRALLRLGVCLLFSQRDLPVPLILNETVLLAKELGSEKSYRLLNGVLNRVAGWRDEAENTSSMES